ncbi:MAG: hypothetical protein EBZ48_08350 [Proteobacteria bacterium]|nr:hypothetical protein [Pseudomonadota bacterium]
MNRLVDRFFERSLGQRVALAVFSVLLIAGLGYQYFLSSVLEEEATLEEKKNTLRAQIAQESRIATNLSKYQQEVQELEIRLQGALQELPDEKDIPDLLKSIADLARDSGLEVLLFRPEAEERKNFFAEFPVSMSVEGTFHQIATFFDEVGRMPRIVNVRGIEISAPRTSERGMLVKGDFSAVTFRFLSEAEREAASKATADKKQNIRR